MLTYLLVAASVFPWDASVDSAMGHRHLVLGYSFAWGLQLAYLAFILWRRSSLRKQERK